MDKPSTSPPARGKVRKHLIILNIASLNYSCDETPVLLVIFIVVVYLCHVSCKCMSHPPRYYVTKVQHWWVYPILCEWSVNADILLLQLRISEYHGHNACLGNQGARDITYYHSAPVT